jgi:hypothetical protein
MHAAGEDPRVPFPLATLAADPRDPVTTCSWFAYDPNVAIAGYCQLSNLYMLAIKPEPTTYIAK